MATLLTISRKKRYLLQSVLFFVFGYFLFTKFDFNIVFELILVALYVFVFVSIAHYPNVKLHNMIYGSILPLQLVVAGTLFFYFYPNLSHLFQVISLLGFSFLYYVVSLVDNIFFVVQDREEQIPLYRVASTWGQILSVIIAIPLYAAVFKFNTFFFIQGLIVFISGVLFSFYQLWGLNFDKDMKRTKVGEAILLNLLVGFIAFLSAVSVSFFPTESFLRALFVASTLMFGLNYAQSHLKNDVNDKFLYQSLFISFVFLVILILFQP